LSDSERLDVTAGFAYIQRWRGLPKVRAAALSGDRKRALRMGFRLRSAEKEER
jgi:hypothetical protein